MEEKMNHPELQNLRRWILLTSTASWLYKKYGFETIQNSTAYMEKHNSEVYKENL